MNSIIMLGLKEQLLKASATAELSGLCRHKTGNLSVINRNEGYIIITPSGISKAKLAMADLVVCDLSGNIIENSNSNQPSIELGMHLSCYSNRQDIDSVIHTHSSFATAFAVNGMEIPPVVSESVFYGNYTKVIGYEEPGSQELINLVNEGINNCDVLVLERHGIICMGKLLEETLLKAKYVEEVAKVAILANILKIGNMQ